MLTVIRKVEAMLGVGPLLLRDGPGYRGTTDEEERTSVDTSCLGDSEELVTWAADLQWAPGT